MSNETPSSDANTTTKQPRLLTVICVATTFAVAAVAGIFWYQSARATNAPINVRLVVTSWPTARLLYAADSLGFFKRHGLHVELIDVGDDSVSGSNEIRDNKADGGALVLTEPFVLTAQGVPMKVTLNTDYSNGANGIVADENVHDVADLKGKTVARAAHTDGDFLLSEALGAAGLRDSDVVGVERTSSTGAGDFLNHSVDAVVTLEPYLSQAAARDHSHIIFTSAQAPGLLPDVVAFRADYAATHHQQIVEFMSAWFDLVDYLRASDMQRHEVLAVAAIKGGISISDMEHELAGVRLFGFTDNAAAFTYGPDISSLYGSAHRLADFFVMRGVTQSPLEIQNIIDPTFLRSGLQ